MKKIVSNLSVMIFVIGCAIMEITTWFIDSYVMFYIGIIIVIVGIIGMIIQGKFKRVKIDKKLRKGENENEKKS